MAQTSNYVRLALKPEDMEHLIELLGPVEDALVYRLRAKWLEFQAEQDQQVAALATPPKSRAKRVARAG